MKQDSEIAPRRTRSKEFLIKKFSDLCELGVSVVNTSSQKTRNNQILRRHLCQSPLEISFGLRF